MDESSSDDGGSSGGSSAAGGSLPLAPWFVEAAVLPPPLPRRGCGEEDGEHRGGADCGGAADDWLVVQQSAALRDAPSNDATFLGTIPKGMRVRGVQHSVEGEPWLLMSAQVWPPPTGFGSAALLEITGCESVWAFVGPPAPRRRKAAEPGRSAAEAPALRRLEADEACPGDRDLERKPTWRAPRRRIERDESSPGAAVLRFVPPARLDGHWLDAAGDEIATIQGDAVLWTGGWPSRLQHDDEGAFSTRLEGLGDLSARLDDEGRLVWEDGDVWALSPPSCPSSSPARPGAPPPPPASSSSSSSPSPAPRGGRAPAQAPGRGASAAAAAGAPARRAPTTILLARHGERWDDAEGAINQRAWVPTADRPWDPPLTATGRLQAVRLGRRARHHCARLGLAPLGRVFASPFERCFETAAVAAWAAGVARVCVEPSLSEGLGESFFRSWAVPGADGTWGGPRGCRLGVKVAEKDVRPAGRGPAGDLVPLGRLLGCPGVGFAAVDEGYAPLLRHEDLRYTWGNFESERQLEARMRSFFDHVAITYPGETVLLVSHAGPTQALFRSVMPAAEVPHCGYCAFFVITREAGSRTWEAPVVPPAVPDLPPLFDQLDDSDEDEEPQQLGDRMPKEVVQARRAEWVRMATEIFKGFDADADGFWDFRETSSVMAKTLGFKLPASVFQMILSGFPEMKDACPRLSKEQVISIYTKARMQRRFMGLFDVRRDHALLFSRGTGSAGVGGAGAGAGSGGASASAPAAPPCAQCGQPAAQATLGEGEFAGQLFCAGCWEAWERAEEAPRLQGEPPPQPASASGPAPAAVSPPSSGPPAPAPASGGAAAAGAAATAPAAAGRGGRAAYDGPSLEEMLKELDKLEEEDGEGQQGAAREVAARPRGSGPGGYPAAQTRAASARKNKH